jgi:hypothetical protein
MTDVAADLDLPDTELTGQLALTNPKIVYLDQNKWIDLARAVKYPDEKPEMRAVLEWLIGELKAGRVVIPLTATNIFETHKINIVERRLDLAHIQATMSSGLVFRGRYKRLEIELVDVIRAAYALSKLEREKNWFLSNVFFESFLEWGDPRFGDAVSKPVLDLIRGRPLSMLFDFLIAQPEDIRRTSVAQFTQGSNELAERIEARRKRDRGESKETRRNLQNAMLMCNELDHILACVTLAGVPGKAAFDILRDNAHAIMDGTPTYYIEREMALLLENQHNRPIHENDFRDMQTFCAVVAYADVIAAENMFSSLARQARLDKKYNTRIVTSLLKLQAGSK